MSDLIDRAEVMKLLDEQCWNGMFTYFRGEHHVNCFRELVKAIPSVENKGDLISRKAIDDVVAEIKSWYWQADRQALAKDPCVVDAMVDMFIRTIYKHIGKAERGEQNE